MNKEYRRIEGFINRLKSSGKIRLAKSDFRFFSESLKELSGTEIKEVHIASTIINFYKEIDFINLLWYVAEDTKLKFIEEDVDIVEGSLNVPTFSTLVDHLKSRNSESIIDPFHNLEESDYLTLKDYFPFDVLNGNGAVCFKLDNGSIKDELHYISIGDESYIKPLGVNIESYLNKGYENYFFSDWQKAVLLNDTKVRETMDFYLIQLKS